jgi:hypothetical protein
MGASLPITVPEDGEGVGTTDLRSNVRLRSVPHADA